MEKLFASFFRGNITPEQENELWDYINSSPENSKLFDAADLAWRKNPEIPERLRGEFNQLQTKLSEKHRRSIIRRNTVISCLAAACLAAAMVFIPRTGVTETGTLGYVESEDVQYLPDGTGVSLNNGSTLSYQFSRKERLVRLNGEAMFSVEHNPKAPFVVNSGNFAITVLGTRFCVTDYPEDTNAQVILAEGSLHLEIAGREATLEPGDKVYYDGTKIRRTKVDPSEADSWKRGAILFDSISLNDFVNRLSREYGVDVIIASDKYAGATFRASFQREESVVNILQTLCDIFPLRVKEKDGQLILYNK